MQKIWIYDKIPETSYDSGWMDKELFNSWFLWHFLICIYNPNFYCMIIFTGHIKSALKQQVFLVISSVGG